MDNELLSKHNHVVQWLNQLKEILPSIIEDIQIDTKKDEKDLVTNVDKFVQEILSDHIKKEYPEHVILGEESTVESPINDTGDIWVIDPIDGTTNFVKQFDHFAIMIAYFKNGVGQLGYIYDIKADQLYYAIKGTGAFVNGEKMIPPERSNLKDCLVSIDTVSWYHTKEFAELTNQCFDLRYFGCSGIESIHIFEGKFGAYINHHAGAWDLAPQIVFANELGLKISQFDGSPVDFLNGGEFILANEGCYPELINIFSDKGKIIN